MEHRRNGGWEGTKNTVTRKKQRSEGGREEGREAGREGGRL